MRKSVKFLKGGNLDVAYTEPETLGKARLKLSTVRCYLRFHSVKKVIGSDAFFQLSQCELLQLEQVVVVGFLSLYNHSRSAIESSFLSGEITQLTHRVRVDHDSTRYIRAI
jgi:hypothetical protein